jgi:hypothetical protein
VILALSLIPYESSGNVLCCSDAFEYARKKNSKSRNDITLPIAFINECKKDLGDWRDDENVYHDEKEKGECTG